MDGAKKGSQIIDRTGQQWGQYRIISSLEQGRFSRAYLGEHVSTSKQFVIDILPMPLTKEQIDIFLRQARSLTQLTHQHILRLVDAGVENFTPFVVLDYLSHIPLRQLYQKGTGQPLDKLLPYLWQAVAALQYAHDKGFLHKNLRPENVLLGWSSGTLLCDFAIDIVTENEQYQNYQRSREPVDAMAYTAPEQLQRQAVPASDQYSLAMMVYEWLSGAPAFQGTYFELANRQRNTPPPPLRQKAPQVSAQVEDVIMTALAKDPSRRFGSVTAFMNALEQASNPNQAASAPTAPPRQLPSSAPAPGQSAPAAPTGRVAPPTPIPPVQPVPDPTPAGALYETQAAPVAAPAQQSHPPIITSSATISPVLPGSPAAPTIPPVTPAPEPPAPRRDRGNPTRRALFIAAAGIAVFGGGGAWLAWQKTHPVSPPPATPGPTPEPPTATFPASQEGAPILVYKEHQDRVNGVDWSPDGTLIASASADKTVLICDLKGKTVRTYTGHKDSVRAVAWSPDGKKIASGSADKTVQVWEAATGKLLFTYKGHLGAVNAVAWSSDSRMIASGSDDHTVHIWFPATGLVHLRYIKHTAAVSAVAWGPGNTKVVSASWDKTVQAFATAPIKQGNFLIGQRIFLYAAHTDEVYTVAWSPNGNIIASAGADGQVLFANSVNGADVKIDGQKLAARGHQAPVRSISWSPDSKFLVAGDDNKEVRVWNATVAKEDRLPFTFTNHTDAVLSTAWSPVNGSKQIVSAGADRSVQVWEAKSGA